MTNPINGPRRLALRLASAVLALCSTAAYSGNVAYTYDNLGRLKTATYTNGVVVTVITYKYDAAGNRTSVETSGA